MVLEKLDLQRKHHIPFVVIFLENNADIFLQTKNGRLPFEVFLEKIGSRWFRSNRTSRLRNPDLKMFIARKANINITLKSGRTLLNEALHNSIFLRDCELGQILCKTADVKKADSTGNYPLHVMARTGLSIDKETSLNWAKVLFQRGANPNQAKQAGESPLIVLLSTMYYTEEKLALAELFLESGASLMMRDPKDNLPIYYVARGIHFGQQTQLLELLLQTSQLKEITKSTTWVGK